MAVKLAPDQLKLSQVAPAPPSARQDVPSADVQALAGGRRRWPAGRQATGPFHGREVALLLVIRRRLLTKRARRASCVFHHGKQRPIKRRLRVVKLRQRRRAAGRRLARLQAATHAGSPSRGRRINAFLNRVKTLYIFAATGQYAAGGNRTLSSILASHVAQGVLSGASLALRARRAAFARG